MGFSPASFSTLQVAREPEAHDGGLVVSNVDKMDAGEVLLRFLYHAVNMNSFGRADLGRNHKLTVVKQFSNSHNSIHS